MHRPGSVEAVDSNELEPTQWKISGERLVDENPFTRLSRVRNTNGVSGMFG
jgi:hypothetical protein